MKKYISLPPEKQRSANRLVFCRGIGSISTNQNGKRVHLRYVEGPLWQEAAAVCCAAAAYLCLRTFKGLAGAYLLQRLGFGPDKE